MTKNTEITRLTPRGHMDILSQLEVSQLKQGNVNDGLYDIFSRCSLAVLLPNFRPYVDAACIHTSRGPWFFRGLS